MWRGRAGGGDGDAGDGGDGVWKERGVVQRWQRDNAEKEEEEGRDIPSHLQRRAELLDGPGYACMHGRGVSVRKAHLMARCSFVYFCSSSPN